MIDRVFFVVTALLAAIILTMLVNMAKADQRTIYGSDGRAIGRSTVDSQGTRTLYGSDGRAISPETNTRGGSTVYDSLPDRGGGIGTNRQI